MSNAVLAALPLGDGFDMHGDFGGGWWMVMMFGMVLFWALVIVGIVWIVREIGGRREHGVGETPVALLDRRFAAGDISVDEYRERRAALVGEEPEQKHDTDESA
jgi:putative membrane protein